MEPEWRQNDVRRHIAGSARTMVFIVREAHGAVSARLLETIFSTVALQTIFGEVLGSVFADLGPFCVPSGVPGRSILVSKMRFGWRSDF